MKKLVYRAAQGILLCSLSATLPAFAQDAHPEQNDHERQTQRNEHRAQQPAQSHSTQQTNQRPEEHQAQRRNQEGSNPGDTHVQQQQPNYRPQQQQSYHPQQQNRDERSSQYRAEQGRGSHGRPAEWGRSPAHRGSYQFRSDDRSRLHSYYMGRLRAIDRDNRPVFRAGGYFPYAEIGYLSPLPPELYSELPPPPPGYEMGYYDGYVVVYDPVTYFIASIIDLLQ